MTIETDHPAVQAYLERLDRAAAHLAPERRAELRAEIVSHVADAVPPDADDALVHEALRRLGPPEDIVAAEQGDHPSADQPGAEAPTGVAHEVLAVVFLTVGSVIPVVGWLVGLVLLWTSRLWSTREKLLATLVFPGGPGIGLFVAVPLALFAGEACTSVTTVDPVTGAPAQGPETCTGGSGVPPWVTTAAFVLYVLLPFVVGFLLYRRAARRAASRQAGAARPLRLAVLGAVLVALAVALVTALLLGGLALRSNGTPADVGPADVPVPVEETSEGAGTP